VIGKPNKEETAMADPTMALMEYLGNMDLEPDDGFLQEVLQ
jgi:hypothetical protein